MLTNLRSLQINEDKYQIEDARITGRQILTLASLRPADEYLIFLKLNAGQMEEIRLDELIDLEDGASFLVERSDRTYYFVIDGERRSWPLKFITGSEIKKRAGLNPSTHRVFQELRDAPDRQIADDEKVNLDLEGIERFATKAININVKINSRPVTFSQEKVTGLEIKCAAIEQGVAIQKDFLLFEVQPNSRLKQIGNDESINLKEGQTFRVTADDDNS